jgi:hypothetical protein
MMDVEIQTGVTNADKGKSAINAILERTSRSQALMWEMDENMSLLEKNQPCEAFKLLLRSRSPLEAITDIQKQARNVGEDFLEDQLGLDKLSGLSESERAMRKKALVVIDTFLDKVDKAKSRLSELAAGAIAGAEPPAVKVVGQEGSRLTKGVKRKIKEVDVVADTCDRIATALAEIVPADVGTLLAQILPHSLGQAHDKRHRFQHQAVEVVEQLLQGMEDQLKNTIVEAQNKLDEVRKQVAPCETSVTDAEAKLVEDGERFSRETATLATAARKYRSARSVLREVQEAQLVGDRDYEVAVKKKQELQSIIDDLITPLRNGTIPDVDVPNKIESLLLVLRQLGSSFDDAILRVLSSALSKSPSVRGNFELMAIDQLVKSMAKLMEAEDAILDAGEGGKLQRAAAVQSAQEALDEALKQQKLHAEVFEAAWDAKKHTEQALSTHRQTSKSLTSQIKSGAKAVYKAEADSEVFQDGARSAFEVLKHAN